jgi:hypothetical protein
MLCDIFDLQINENVDNLWSQMAIKIVCTKHKTKRAQKKNLVFVL